MWSGASDAVPDGWALCNGENNTPDLRDRFVLGAGNEYEVGATGGEATHTLTIDEMPKHSHGIGSNSGHNMWANPWSEPLLGTYGQQSGITGGDQPHNNMPPYYALCFIMKL